MTVPNVVGMNYKDAKKTLEEVGLEITLRNESAEAEITKDFTITNQVPASGVEILSGGSVIVE